MRPILLIVLLVLVAAALVGGLLLVGDGVTEPGAATPAAPTAIPGPGTAGPGAADPPPLEGVGASETGGRAAHVAAPEPEAASAASSASGPAPVVLRGRVLGNLGRPLEGATVYAAEANQFLDFRLDEIDFARSPWIQRAEATTGADGRFEIRPQARAKVQLAVRAPGFAPLDREFALSGAERDVGELVLDASVVLEGRVVDAAGSAVPGAEISRIAGEGPGFSPLGWARGALVATTDARGLFRVDQLASGPWRLLVRHEDHPDSVETGETDRPGTVRSGLVFTLEEGAEIHGRVAGAPADALQQLVVRAVAQPPGGGEDPIESAIASRPRRGASTREASVESDGSFVLKGLRVDRGYRLTARDADRRMFARSRSQPVTAHAGDRGVVLEYRSETALVFQVVDATSGDPVADLTARAGYGFLMPLLDEDGRPMRHFPDGRVRFGNLPAPRISGGGRSGDGLKLVIEAAGYRALELENVAVLPGEDTDLGVLRLERAPVVRVLVLDAENGAPVEGARVQLAEERAGNGFGMSHSVSVRVEDGEEEDASPFAPGAAQRARTDAEGRATVTSLPGRTARLRVTHAGHARHVSEPITLPIGEDVERTVRLGVGGTVVVEVVDGRDGPVSGAEVDHQAPGDDPGEVVMSGNDGRTDAEGRLVFDHLEPGPHRFRLRDSPEGGIVPFGGGAAFVTRRVSMNGGEDDTGDWTTIEVAERSAETLRLVAPSRGSLAGRVTEGGRPLVGAELRLVPASQAPDALPFFQSGSETRTDGRGEYLLDGVEEGEYRLEIRHATRAMSSTAEARVREGENRLDVDLPVAIVEGTVRGADGKPIAGARVRAERAPDDSGGGRQPYRMAVMITDDGGDEPEVMVGPPGGGPPVLTDEEGRYSLRGVQPDVDLVVRANGEDVQPGRSEAFHVAPDEVKRHVDLVLEDGGSIEVSVVRVGGGRPGRYLARATPDGGGEPKVQMVGPSGSTRLTGLKPGKWKVVLDSLMGPLEGGSDAEDGPPLERDVEVVAGASAKAAFEVP